MKKLYTLLFALVAVAFGLSAGVKATSVTGFSMRPTEFLRPANLDDSKIAKLPVDLDNIKRGDLKETKSLSGWTSLGEVEYHDDCLTTFWNFNGELVWNVEIEENDDTPGLYRLVNPYEWLGDQLAAGGVAYDSSTDHYLILHAEDPNKVYFEGFNTGLDFGYGAVSINSAVYYFMGQGRTLDEIAATGNYCGTLVGGNVTFPTDQLIISMPGLGNGGLYPANTNGKFLIKFPGAKDYSLAVSMDLCTGDDTLPYTIEKGEDITAIKYAVLNGNEGYNFTSADYAYLNEMYNLPEIPVTLFDENGVYEDKFDNLSEAEEGRQNMLVLGFNEDGELVATEFNFFYVLPRSDEGWTYRTDVSYRDDLVAAIYETFATIPAWDVEVWEKDDTPGLYRLKNPYANSQTFAQVNQHGDDHAHYMTINATDPTKVTIPYSPIGVDFGQGYGGMLVCSATELDEDYKTSEYYGTLVDGVITFPAKALCIMEQNGSHGAAYTANRRGYFEIDLSDFIAGIDSVVADNAEATAKYYNLQGMEIANPAEGNLYIVKKGNKTFKAILK